MAVLPCGKSNFFSKWPTQVRLRVRGRDKGISHMIDIVKCGLSERPEWFFLRIDLGTMLVGQFHILSHSKL